MKQILTHNQYYPIFKRNHTVLVTKIFFKGEQHLGIFYTCPNSNIANRHKIQLSKHLISKLEVHTFRNMRITYCY